VDVVSGGEMTIFKLVNGVNGAIIDGIVDIA